MTNRTTIPAITLHQPWAWLMCEAFKRRETRGWSTRLRGWCAIHAGKSVPAYARQGCLENKAIVEAFAARGLPSEPLRLPLGCVVAVARLVDVVATDAIAAVVLEHEGQLGNYGPGRFAWEFADLHKLAEPVPVRGHQQFWQWEPPAALREVMRRADAERLALTA